MSLRRCRPSASALLCSLAVIAPLASTVCFAAAGNAGIDRKLIVGYQGWFGCPGDFENNRSWQHWFVKRAEAQNITVDILPSLRRFDPSDLCDSGLRRADGSVVYLFSAQNRRIVAMHFRWMREYGIDGAAVQRFVAATVDPQRRRRSDNVFRNVMAAAEEQGRVFYVTYDVSGADPATVVDDVRNDWRHLVNDLRLTASPSYLVDHGKPLLELWGFGFGDRPGAAPAVGELIAELKTGRGGGPRVTLIGGVPTGWRTLGGDSKSEAAWAAVFRSYDVLSPWSVGRFADDAGADAFRRNYLQPDLAETRRLGIVYMPVVFPGFSWANLMTNRGRPERAALNQVPRRCGRFMWRQVANIMETGATTIYAAMFDEADEGTALFSAETRADRLPVAAKMVVLNQDGCALPDDWYLRVTGKAAEFVRNGSIPPRQLERVLTP